MCVILQSVELAPRPPRFHRWDENTRAHRCPSYAEVQFAWGLRQGYDWVGGLFSQYKQLITDGRTVDVRIGDRLGGDLGGMGRMTELLVRALVNSGARVCVEHGPAQQGPSCGIHAAEWAARINTVGFPALMSTSTAEHAADEDWFRMCNEAVGRRPYNATHWYVHRCLRARTPIRMIAACSRRPSVDVHARPPTRRRVPPPC